MGDNNISRERYRQLVAKNQRLWKRLSELETMLEDSSTKKLLDEKNARIATLRGKVIKFYEAVRNLNEPMYESAAEYFEDENQTEHDIEE